MQAKAGISLETKRLVLMALFIALSLLGANIKIFGTIAFDSLPGFVAALVLGPAYGALIGFFGHLLTALTSGFPLMIPVHMAIATSMAITMLGFGFAYQLLSKKLSLICRLALTGLIGIILNGPVSLVFSIGAMALMVGPEAAWGLVAILPILVLAAAANVLLSMIIYCRLKNIWSQIR